MFADEIASYTQSGAGPDGKGQLKRMVSEEAKLKRMRSVSESEKKEEKKVWCGNVECLRKRYDVVMLSVWEKGMMW